MTVPQSADTRSPAPPPLEEVTLDLVNLVAYAAHGRHASRRFPEATGIELPQSQMRTLLALSHAGRPSMGEVAAALDLDLGQTSRQMAALEKLGLAGRVPDPDDGRRTLLVLTPQGAEANDAWRDAWSQDYLEPVADWDEQEITSLTAWLSRVEWSLRRGLAGISAGLRPPTGWLPRVPRGEKSAALASYAVTVVGLVEMVGLSRGFDGLLGQVHAPIRQHAFFALRLIAARGPLPVTELAAHLGVTHPQASKRVRMLAEHGLVESFPGEQDRRVTMTRTTVPGLRLIEDVRQVQAQGFSGLVGEVPGEYRDTWAELTGRLFAELSLILDKLE